MKVAREGMAISAKRFVIMRRRCTADLYAILGGRYDSAFIMPKDSLLYLRDYKRSINGSRDGFRRYKSDSSLKTQLGMRDERGVGRLIVRDQTSSLESFVHLRRLTTDYLHRLEFSAALI